MPNGKRTRAVAVRYALLRCHSWRFRNHAMLGLVCYMVAFFNSLWIIVGIWRSGKA